MNFTDWLTIGLALGLGFGGGLSITFVLGLLVCSVLYNTVYQMYFKSESNDGK